MFTALLKNLKENRRTIVFTEGPDQRIQTAAARLLAEDLMDVILVGNVEEVKAAAEKKRLRHLQGGDHRPRDLRGHGRDGGQDGGAAEGPR